MRLVILLAGFQLFLALSFTSFGFSGQDLCKDYAVNGEYDKAIEECTRQINGEIQVRHLEYSYSNRGAAYAGKKHYDEAIADYDKALELNPAYATAYYNRAIAHSTRNRLDEAIADYSKALELNPGNASAYMGRATVYANRKQYDEAIADYNKVLELSPEDPGALVGRAIAHANKGRHDRGTPQAGVASKPGATPSPPAVAGAVGSPSSTAPASAGGEKVSRPLSMRKEPGKIAASEGGKGTFSVQLGAFSNEHNAVRLAGQLKEKGYDAFVVEGFVTGKGTLHLVLIGRFKDRREAVRAAAGIKSKENVAPLIYAE